MKIGIDARLYGPKVGGGGLGRYVEQLVTELQRIDKKNRYVLFLKKDNFDTCKITNPNFKKVLADVHWYTVAEQIKMPKIVDAEKCDFVHYPHWNIPLRAKTPFMVTIHDLIMLEEPNSNKASNLDPIRYHLKYAGYKTVLRRAVNKAKQIIAVSNFTKGSILKNFTVKPDKIDVIHEGVTHLRQDFGGQAVKRPFEAPYLLYVGNAYPHKNLESLLHAFSFFHRLHPEVKLVLVGKKDAFWKWLEQEFDEIDVPHESVIFFGYASEEELDQLYEHAALYVFPSRHEGFGLPPLEAMARGVPVAASKTTAIPEILGDAAVYFYPDDIEGMVEVMEQGLTDAKLREKLISKGTSQVKKYSWSTMAREILELYNKQG